MITTRIERMKINDLKLLELNARYMTHEMFQQLVENIKRDGDLTSIPFAWKDKDGKYLVISGNHRVQAAKEAGLKEINVLLTDDPLTYDQRVAIQLSHNAISGEDDPAILRQLYESIIDLDFKQYSGLDDKTLKLLEITKIDGLPEIDLDYQNVMLIFLPDEKERLEAVLTKALTVTPGKEIWTARWGDYDRFMDALTTTMTSYNIKNFATALWIILEVFERHLGDLKEGWLGEKGVKTQNQVPITTIFGTDMVKPKDARIVNQALEKMVSRGELAKETLTDALTIWAKNYLEVAKRG